jgi:hypothetical protein
LVEPLLEESHVVWLGNPYYLLVPTRLLTIHKGTVYIGTQKVNRNGVPMAIKDSILIKRETVGQTVAVMKCVTKGIA